MLYLLTSPHRNIMGFYFLPSPYACFDLGWDEQRFNKGLHELIQIGVVRYDLDAHVVLIQNYLKHNPLENPNQVKSAIERLEEMPQTQLFRDFLTVLEQSPKPFTQPLAERLQQRLGQPGTVTVTEAVTGTGEGDTCASDDARERLAGQDSGGSVEAEKVTATPDEQQEVSGDKPRSPFRSKKQECMFDEFWAAYPKKRSKGQAEKTWCKIKPSEQLLQQILSALERAKISDNWTKEGGQFIPYPSTWLNAKGWLDEYQPVIAGPRLSPNVRKGMELVAKYSQAEGVGMCDSS